MHLLTLFGERDGFMLGYSIVYPLFIMVCPSLSSLLLFFCVCVCPSVSVHFNAFLCYYEKQRKGDRSHLRWKALKESIEKGKKRRPMNHEFCSDMEIKEKHFDLLYL